MAASIKKTVSIRQPNRNSICQQIGSDQLYRSSGFKEIIQLSHYRGARPETWPKWGGKLSLSDGLTKCQLSREAFASLSNKNPTPRSSTTGRLRSSLSPRDVIYHSWPNLPSHKNGQHYTLDYFSIEPGDSFNSLALWTQFDDFSGNYQQFEHDWQRLLPLSLNDITPIPVSTTTETFPPYHRDTTFSRLTIPNPHYIIPTWTTAPTTENTKEPLELGGFFFIMCMKEAF